MSRGTSSKRVASQGLSHLFLKTFATVYSDPIDRPWAGGRGFDSRGRTGREFWSSKAKWHLRFSLLSIILADLLGNRSLLQWAQKVMVCDLWLMDSDPFCVFLFIKGRFSSNKNSFLKSQKFHLPNGTVHSGCTDPTFAYCSCKQDTKERYRG